MPGSIRSLALALALVAAGSCRGGQASTPSDGAPPRCPETEPVALPCPEPVETRAAGDPLKLERVDFDRLPGWKLDAVAGAVPALLASCARLAELGDDQLIGASARFGRARDWRRPCARAAALPANDHAAARRFFEREFRAYAAPGSGRLTGYYVQSLTGSRRRHGDYQWPIRRRPDDLVEVLLSDFIGDGRGRRVWGRRDPATGKLEPYPTREQIRARPLDPSDVLLWSDDPVGAAFAEIQGSGRVTLDSGDEVWIAFDGKNGRRFRGLGGLMLRLGEIERGQGGVDGVRAWHRRAGNAERFPGILDLNEAVTFFRLSKTAGAIGTQLAVLTPGRSIAVDRGLIALSTPVWVETQAPARPGERPGPWRRLVIAQDTGGSILGPLRGDIYFGAGPGAQKLAHRVNAPGKMWLLLPRKLKISTR